MNIYMVLGGFILFSVVVTVLLCFFMIGANPDQGGRHGR
jgi:hypothetical protein